MTYRTEAQVDRKKCVHGLSYDPVTQHGCVLCRRDPGDLTLPEEPPLPTMRAPAPPAPSAREKGLVAVAMAALILGGLWLTLRMRAIERAATCEGADCPPAESIPGREPRCKSLAGSPGKCIELCIDGCPRGMVCKTVMTYDRGRTRRENQCVPVGTPAADKP